ncbi:MAG: NAD(P)-dependent oxidoreductase [Patescibacteria group bacterium]|nr:NAD(P)-dependent oxidoreductase [Patescibacteria group bacterium]
MKIVIAQNLNLNNEERERLNKLGTVEYYEDLAETPDEWLERCKNADIICTGKFGLKQKVYELKDIFISLPFVGVGFFDLERLKARNIKVSRCPGCNKDAVSEWIVAMILNLFRELPNYLNVLNLKTRRPEASKGLTGKNITILGKGNVGSRVGKICESFDMNVKFFLRGDDLINSIEDADIVVDALSLNESTKGLLDRNFFNSFKKGSYFITVTSSEIYDEKAMFGALDKGKLAGIASDCGSIQFGDVHNESYIKYAKHSKVLATPHIAHNTDVTDRVGNKMMIDNIEAYIKGDPINLIY